MRLLWPITFCMTIHIPSVCVRLETFVFSGHCYSVTLFKINAPSGSKKMKRHERSELQACIEILWNSLKW